MEKQRAEVTQLEVGAVGGASNHGCTDGFYWVGKRLPASMGRLEWDFDLAVTKSAVTLHRLWQHATTTMAVFEGEHDVQKSL